MGAPTNDPIDRYTRWHWGVEPGRQVEIDDPDLPDRLVECGRLVELHYTDPDGTELELIPNEGDPSVVFDMDHPNQRLYVVNLTRRVQDAVRRRFNGSPDRCSLVELAAQAGGRHARSDYPPLVVNPIGVLDAIVYRTHKKGDENPHSDESEYIHALGEESGIKPILASDARGRLWIAGGNYTAPYDGITD